MNIFVTHRNPRDAAEYLFKNDYKRANKMILESAQLLSNALHAGSFFSVIAPYKPTHMQHPATKWVTKSLDNFCWLLCYFTWLTLLYYQRNSREHRCNQHRSVFRLFLEYCNEQRALETVEFANITPFKELEITEAYKKHLQLKWENDKLK